jgi:hypothetical protein
VDTYTEEDWVAARATWSSTRPRTAKAVAVWQAEGDAAGLTDDTPTGYTMWLRRGAGRPVVLSGAGGGVTGWAYVPEARQSPAATRR